MTARGARFSRWEFETEFATQPGPLVCHGDILSTVARATSLIRHWGVLDLKRREIVHCVASGVEATPLDGWTHRNARVEIRTREQDRDLVVQRARSRIGEHYDLALFNCEQFARWAATGKSESVQLQRAFLLGVGAWLLFS
jgi:hypothetical protein